ncbi:universal stress protein [Leptolyngbya boryana CZ1]|uniref:Universal stress protein n=1 Tax=Leptolyngbya boryana CZ1 TaxID=3060204 RepID=A0AA96WXV5_LEPBY|nr:MULTISPECIES: universal stress protein [Leptolyngbya]MBN8560634.1 universal stress protein [Leptolyngbya sp. UWPOB_LEPTO1]WNZ47896.1 universal stress protein [Leptolyngbya boryana CZ1]
MLKKILVALDDSAMSAIVLEQALAIARAMNAHLMILHVLAVDEAGLPLEKFLKADQSMSFQAGQKFQQAWQTYQTEWETRLQSYVQQASALGVPAEASQSYGNPGHVICDWVWAWKADLVVMGRQGQSQLPGWMMGSVSAYVTQHASCSVFLVSAAQKQESTEIRDRALTEV